MKTLAIILTFLFAVSSAYAERKALVIGNADYNSRPLKNPPNDARDISQKLTTLGFIVTTKTNLSRAAMREQIRNFSKTLSANDEALFYFSGHGAQVNGQNYLIPLGNDIQDEDEVSDEAVSLHFVLNKFTNSPSKLNIVILDACRDNPFKSRFKNNARGLARLNQRIKGTIVAFAASAGGISNDGNNRNGTYTQYLLKHLATPNITLNQMFNRVRADVNKATNGGQFPIEENGLLSDVYLLQVEHTTPDRGTSIYSEKGSHSTLTKLNLNGQILDVEISENIKEKFKKLRALIFVKNIKGIFVLEESFQQVLTNNDVQSFQKKGDSDGKERLVFMKDDNNKTFVEYLSKFK